uniref:Protein Wnt n=1 Tax=Panagrolaimus sp. JU765 TaxID=591449 RepID=A0AC34QSD5_9BILA
MKLIKLAVFLFLFPAVFGIKWLSISTLKSTFLEPSDCPTSKEQKKTLGFVQHQSELCRRMIELMPFVKSAADETVSSCLETFKEHRWNCSSLLKAPNFDSDLTKGTKEQAYVYALSSAAVVHQIAKACSSGSIDFCQCGKGGTLILNKTNENDLPPMDENYQWQGCSDNVEYGLSASQEWADAPWHSKVRLSRDLTGGFLDQIEIYEMEKERHTNEKKPPNFDGKKIAMNQQNNNVGRQTIAKNSNMLEHAANDERDLTKAEIKIFDRPAI